MTKNGRISLRKVTMLPVGTIESIIPNRPIGGSLEKVIIQTVLMKDHVVALTARAAGEIQNQIAIGSVIRTRRIALAMQVIRKKKMAIALKDPTGIVPLKDTPRTPIEEQAIIAMANDLTVRTAIRINSGAKQETIIIVPTGRTDPAETMVTGLIQLIGTEHTGRAIRIVSIGFIGMIRTSDPEGVKMPLVKNTLAVPIRKVGRTVKDAQIVLPVLRSAVNPVRQKGLLLQDPMVVLVGPE
jgi:hypothetical protein